MKVHIYHERNKKLINEKTKIVISFRSKNKRYIQTSLLLVIREYYNKNTNEVVYAEVLLEIE